MAAQPVIVMVLVVAEAAVAAADSVEIVEEVQVLAVVHQAVDLISKIIIKVVVAVEAQARHRLGTGKPMVAFLTN